MDLTTKDVANLLHVSEDVIQGWIAQGTIPFYNLKGDYRFNREEIEEWMLRLVHQDDLPIDFKEHVEGMQQFVLYRAIHKGIVIDEVEGTNKQELIHNAMQILSQKLDLDAEVLTNLLLDRERLMSTALNRGVAVPHTRDFLISKPFDVVAVVYPKKPIEYGALDNEDVHSLFFLFACNDQRHLKLLAKIAFFCHDPKNLALLQDKPSKKELLQHIRQWESQLNSLQPA